ncbi:MAG TPA: Xaa-Pro peptidase family protein [Thermomicrobiaceae bacterium]|nr:Xaa-Pro peptidase family protein [Thermomicrobiaceae bacterium]
MANTIVPEKLRQATEILNERDIDLWMLVARESDLLGDPSLPLVVGTSVTWESFFLISRSGEHRAIVGNGDVENIKQTGAWGDVRGYVQGARDELVGALEQIDPRQIALNYSTDNNIADGLTYGMYLRLQALLTGTPYFERVVSGEPVASRLRARKSAEEQRRIRAAVATTDEIWGALEERVKPGMSEREIADFMHAELDRRDIGSSWDWRYCPGVTAGPNSPIGHVGPTDVAIEPGQLLSIDFGVRQDDYCSDMQRTYYFLREGEREAPAPVLRAFEVVSGAIQEAAAMLKPGVPGWEVDQVAREIFAKAGAEEWGYALGHQLGRACHDGGCLLGPRWERYGERPYDRVEADEVYTLEIGVSVPGYGRVSLEEDVVVTQDGCEFLSEPQRRPILIG